MPMHDWSRVPAGLFHHFHQDWSIEITRTLNRGRLPRGLSALVEQRAGRKEPDLLTIEEIGPKKSGVGSDPGAAILQRPKTQYIKRTSNQSFATRANRIVIRHHLGRIVAVIELVSPGNKESRAAIHDFVGKIVEFLNQGIHVLIVDLFPPSPRDPAGIHKVIWDKFTDDEFALPKGKDRTLVSYDADDDTTAYIETVGVGDLLPEMPLILSRDLHVLVPLESTYRAAWDASPEAYRHAVETGEMPVQEPE